MIFSKDRVQEIIDKIESNNNVEKVLMLCLAGSHAYGTSLPTSDVDIRGIFLAKKHVICTPFTIFKEMDIPGEEDGKVYELNNFMDLFCDMNPNILELAFTDESATLYTSPEWDKYLSNELPKLLNKNVAYRFSGYAMSQLKRIKGHNKWINQPQAEEPPTQKDFVRLVHNYLSEPIAGHEKFISRLSNLEDMCALLPYGNDTYAVVYNAKSPGIFNKDGSIRKMEYDEFSEEDKKMKPAMIIKYLSEDHRQAREKHHNYWTWVKNRNTKRHELEEKYGYDTKHAMHLVRLLRMGEEILSEGKVNVKRPDAQELLDIRNGKLSYDEILEWAEKKDEYIRGELMEKSNLPKRSDRKSAERMIISVQDAAWSDHG